VVADGCAKTGGEPGARGYQDVGARSWLLSLSGKYDARGVELVRGHYSRRKPDSPQFMPPGETFVLVSRDQHALWGWWRPHPRSGVRAMNGLDGWTCTVLRRPAEGAQREPGLLLQGRRLVPHGPGGQGRKRPAMEAAGAGRCRRVRPATVTRMKRRPPTAEELEQLQAERRQRARNRQRV